MEEIRPVRPEEFDQLVFVTASAFLNDDARDPYGAWRRWLSRDPRFSFERTMGVFVDGTLRASIVTIEREVWIGEQRVMLGGIADVATLPAERRQGHAGKLLIATCKAMKEMGYPISALGPFSYRYYRKFGWEVGEDVYALSLAPVDFRQGESFFIPAYEEIGRVSEIDKNNDADLLEVMRVYATWTYGKTFRHIRDERDWKESILYDEGATPQGGSRKLAAYHDQDGTIQGYVMYSSGDVRSNAYSSPAMHNPRGLKTLRIQEMIGLTPEARRGLAAYAGRLVIEDQTILKMTQNAPLEDYQANYLLTPSTELRIVPGDMVRVVDIPAAFAALSAPATARGSFALEVQEVEGLESDTYQVEVEDGRVTAKHAETGANDHTLSCDIQTLSQMYFGYRVPDHERSLGKLKGDNAEAFALAEQIFPQRHPFLYGVDHF